MRTHTQKIVAAIVLTLTLVSSPLASAADEQTSRPCMLVGGAETVWVILFDKDGSGYKLAARPIGDKAEWKPVGTDRTGSIVAATSDGGSLVVFFSDGENMRYFPHRSQGQPGTKPPDDLFGKDAQILASAPAADGNDAVIVLVARPIGRRPRTRPALPIVSTQRAKLGELALLQYASQKWRQVAVVPNELIKSATRAHVAVHKNTIYVLAEHPKETLAVFDEGEWRQIDLPDTPADSRPLAMMVIEDALVLAAFDAGVVNLARFASGEWQLTQPVKRDGKNLTWPADAPPVVARFAGKAAMMWKTDKKWLFTTCKPDGQADDESPMNAFTWADEQEQIEQMQNIFFMVVFGMIVVLMFWPGQPLRTMPFSLPATIAPARLTRRFAAACVDALPFLFIATAIGAKDLDTTTVATFEQAKQAVSTTRFLYAFWGFLVVYPAYCFVMEYRFGATVGKMILRLRVVADKGRKPLMRELALRNVSKAIEILGLVMIFPLLFPLLTRYRQRLGDKIAWTAVIDADAVGPTENLTDGEKTENRPDGEDKK
jgi:uncharacterized RDD family membrane protein YckC